MNAAEMLRGAGVSATGRRLLVLETLVSAGSAVSAPELLASLGQSMNKVTLYRILDLLVDKHILARHSGPDRTAHYCLGTGHGHFHCRRCGRCLCLHLPGTGLDPASAGLDALGRVDEIEVRVEGVCKECLDR
ncbi:MAG: transcriptional repressor [Desulfovibrionaceae bacterium]